MPTAADDLLEAARLAAAKIDLDALSDEMEAALNDPLLQELVAQTVAPYVAVLSEPALDDARKTLAVFFATDPDAAGLLEKARAAAKSRVVAPRTPDALARALHGKKAGRP